MPDQASRRTHRLLSAIDNWMSAIKLGESASTWEQWLEAIDLADQEGTKLLDALHRYSMDDDKESN